MCVRRTTRSHAVTIHLRCKLQRACRAPGPARWRWHLSHDSAQVASCGSYELYATGTRRDPNRDVCLPHPSANPMNDHVPRRFMPTLSSITARDAHIQIPDRKCAPPSLFQQENHIERLQLSFAPPRDAFPLPRSLSLTHCSRAPYSLSATTLPLPPAIACAPRTLINLVFARKCVSFDDLLLHLFARGDMVGPYFERHHSSDDGLLHA